MKSKNAGEPSRRKKLTVAGLGFAAISLTTKRFVVASFEDIRLHVHIAWVRGVPGKVDVKLPAQKCWVLPVRAG